ncbi:MAG: type II secretion system protein [Lentisphaerota bacterium]
MNKYRNKYFYTLVELLMAMAIFAIISVIMMRFFNSAQQIWSKASQKNVMYADARVALDMMTLELQGALYDNKIPVASNAAGIYPFWFEYKDLSDNTFFNNPLAYDAAELRYNKRFVTQLNFIAATTFKPHISASDICEIKYIYLPVRSSTDLDYPTGKWELLPGSYPIKGGTLIRACTGNLKSDGVTANYTAGNTNCLYNFSLLPHVPASTSRVYDIFKKDSSENYSQVIDGIVDMKITCYTLNLISGFYELRSYNPMKYSGGSLAVVTHLIDDTLTDDDLTTNIGSIIAGTPFPVAVKIDLYMLAERDMQEWLTAIKNSNAGQAKIIKNERMRCFSKIIYLSSGK